MTTLQIPKFEVTTKQEALSLSKILGLPILGVKTRELIDNANVFLRDQKALSKAVLKMRLFSENDDYSLVFEAAKLLGVPRIGIKKPELIQNVNNKIKENSL